MLRHFTRNGLRLNCYAPGDGALAFTWVDPKTNYAVNSKVTPGIIRQYVKHSAGKNFGVKGYRIRLINTQIRLVAPIDRIDENKLQLEGRVYRYEVKPDPPFPNNLCCIDLNVFTAHLGEEIEVKHISTLAAMAFFLNHEKELAL